MASPPPPPPSSNNSNIAESQVANVFAASIISIVLSGLFFAGRLTSKRIQRQPINVSDYVLVLSLCCCWGLAIVNMWMTNVGLGRHLAWVMQQHPSGGQVQQLLKVFIADEVFYDLGIASVKISILLLYQSLFVGDRGFSIASNVLMGVVVAWFLGNLLPSIFSCRPISGFWDGDPNAVCIDKTVLYVCGSTINIATDVAILCLPLSKVMKLHLSWRRKLELVVVFLLGSFVCVVSIYRFTVLFDSNSPDITWSFASVLNWSSIEVSVAIASACLPLMRPLLMRVSPRSWPTAASSSTVQDSRVPPIAGLTTIGGTPSPVVVARARGRRGPSYGMSSDFSRLTEDVSVLTTDSSEHEMPMKMLHGSPELTDLERGFGSFGDGIVVTKTVEMSSVDREVAVPLPASIATTTTTTTHTTSASMPTPKPSESSTGMSYHTDSIPYSPAYQELQHQQQHRDGS